VLLGILQTPHRFRSKRPLWNYGGLAIEMHSSADHRSVDGQLQRSRKNVLVRGLNRDCNHDLKNLFKGAAAVARPLSGVLHGFSGKGHAAGDGTADVSQEDCHHCFGVEARSVLRRQSSETTNSLSVFDRVRSWRRLLTQAHPFGLEYNRLIVSETSRGWIEARGPEGDMTSSSPRGWPLLNPFNAGLNTATLFLECQGKMQSYFGREPSVTLALRLLLKLCDSRSAAMHACEESASRVDGTAVALRLGAFADFLAVSLQ
jgi:hypothetical protein